MKKNILLLSLLFIASFGQGAFASTSGDVNKVDFFDLSNHEFLLTDAVYLICKKSRSCKCEACEMYRSSASASNNSSATSVAKRTKPEGSVNSTPTDVTKRKAIRTSKSADRLLQV